MTPHGGAEWWEQYRREERAKREERTRAVREAKEAMERCLLRANPAPWDPKAKRCYLCDSPLPKGLRKWCSIACEEAWWSNHAWSPARYAALRRDGNRCRGCGRGEATGVCDRCAEPWPCGEHRRVEAFYEKHHGYVPRETYSGHREARLPLEVDHIDPRNGRGYEPGCHHHLEPDASGSGGLRTLCRPCHVRRTTVANAIRRMFERASRPALPAVSSASPEVTWDGLTTMPSRR